MEKSYIGIRLADGRLFPIFDRNQSGRKRLVLTTVNDNQESVQIDLYRGVGEEMNEAEYVGTLVIQNVEPAASGDPEISLVLGVDERGNLNATAADEKSGEYESLSVSLEPGVEEESGDFELTDFDLEEDMGLEEEEPTPEEAEPGAEGEAETEWEGEAEAEAPAQEEGGEESEGGLEDLDLGEELGTEMGDELEDFSFDDEELSFEEGDEVREGSVARGRGEERAEETPAGEESPVGEDERADERIDLDALSFQPGEEIIGEAQEPDEDLEIGFADLTEEEEPSEAGEPEKEEPAEFEMELSEGEEDFSFDEADLEAPEDEEFAAEGEGLESGGMDVEEFETSGIETADLDAEGLDAQGFEGGDFETGGLDEDEELEGHDYEETPFHPGDTLKQTTPASTEMGGGNVLLFVAFMILSLAGLGLLTYLIFLVLRGPDLPPIVGSIVNTVSAVARAVVGRF